jgi:pimeloyl-ACP methyl ester carboxylesterase
VALLFMLGVSFFGFRWVEKAITFHPVRYVPGEAWVVPDGAHDVWITTADRVRLHGWFFETRVQPKLATVIFFHGNGGNITNVGWVGERLSARGFQVLLFDYRGYGRSDGTIGDERGLYLDADAAYDFVTRNERPENVILYGQSLGTTVAADVGSRRQCGAMILESGLASASDMAASVLPWFPRSLHFLLRNRFESAGKLRQVKSPVLITHGDPDPVIPTEQGRLLFAAANEPKKLIIFPGAGHNVFGSLGDIYLTQISEFIQDSMSVQGR